jgi:hypothetical protein
MSHPAVQPQQQPAKRAPESPVVAEIRGLATLGDSKAAFALAFAGFGPPECAGNRTQSYLHAVASPGVTYGSARELGSRIIAELETQNYIKDLASVVGINREIIIEQLSALATSDISELANVDSLGDIASLHPRVRASVKKFKRKTSTRTDEEGSQVTDVTTEFEMHSKDAALALAADVLGLRKDQQTQGTTIHVHYGATTALAEDVPIDVTPTAEASGYDDIE